MGAEGILLKAKHASHKGLIANCDACMKAKMKQLKFAQEMNHLAGFLPELYQTFGDQ